MLSTCSLTSGRVSKARTIAPMLLATPIAASPATPAPITSTLAGGTFSGSGDLPGEKAAEVLCRFDQTAR